MKKYIYFNLDAVGQLILTVLKMCLSWQGQLFICTESQAKYIEVFQKTSQIYLLFGLNLSVTRTRQRLGAWTCVNFQHFPEPSEYSVLWSVISFVAPVCINKLQRESRNVLTFYMSPPKRLYKKIIWIDLNLN